MTIQSPMTYEDAKAELQTLSSNIKLELSQHHEKHLLPTDAKAQRDIQYITVLMDEFTQTALNRMLKLYLQGQQEDKPKSSAEHISDMMRRLSQRLAVQ